MQYANEILPVPSGCFSVREAGGKDCSTTGMRRASKAAPSIQKLVILPPILLLQRLRRQHQHLAGEVLLRAVTDAMLRAEQIQRLHCLAVESDEAIQHSRMASDNKVAVVVDVFGDAGALHPLLVGMAEAPVPLEFVQSVGKHPRGALVAVFVQHRRDAVLVQMHSVEILTDGVLDGVAAGDVRLVALPPEGKLVPISRLGRGIGVEIGVIHSEISSFSSRRHTPSIRTPESSSMVRTSSSRSSMSTSAAVFSAACTMTLPSSTKDSSAAVGEIPASAS